MTKPLLAAAAAAALLAGTALAQTTNPATNAPASSAQMNQQSTSGKGITNATTAPAAARFIQSKPADMMTSRLIGADVYNNQNEKLGEIEDLVFEDGKTLNGVVVSVGGFLGMNERYVMIDPSSIVVSKDGDDDDDWKAVIDTSREALTNAPKFEYGGTNS